MCNSRFNGTAIIDLLALLCCISHQVVHFQIAPTDPMLSLSQVFMAAPDYQPHSNSHREGYEPVGEGEGEGEEVLISTGNRQGDSAGELVG